jgi:hypothetical protein
VASGYLLSDSATTYSVVCQLDQTGTVVTSITRLDGGANKINSEGTLAGGRTVGKNPDGSPQSIAVRRDPVYATNSNGDRVIVDYSSIILEGLGGTLSNGIGINDSGMIAGSSKDAAGNTQAVYWPSGDVWPVPLGNLGGAPNTVHAVNGNAGVWVPPTRAVPIGRRCGYRPPVARSRST